MTSSEDASATALEVNPEFESFINSDITKNIIGKNYEYYAKKWDDMSLGTPSATAVSWNWPAFLLNSFWLFYRKQWIAGIIASLALYGISALTPMYPEVGFILLVIFVVYNGIFANKLYYSYVKGKYAEFLRQKDRPLYTIPSGTSILAPILLGVAYIAISFGIEFLDRLVAEGAL